MLDLLLSAALVAPLPAPAAALTPLESARFDTAALYAQHCASCHGANGDGRGTADLDRPARSFLDGGYSYGNTRKAVLRSVTYGIPGTPMPAFAETLGEEERTALADFVIAMGPKGTVVEPGASQIAVEDVPRVVHGMMPAIPGGPAREPRSLVVGFPNGTTLRYARTRGTLDAVYVGQFLDRRDWGGRGGSPLEPMGTLTWKRGEDFADADQCTDADGKLLARSIRGAHVIGQGVRLDFTLTDADGQRVGGGQEFLGFVEVNGIPVGMRTIVSVGRADAPVGYPAAAGDPIGTLEVNGEVASEVRRAGDGVLVLDFEAAPGVRALIHASEWTDALADAVLASLTTKKEGN